jgi:type 1 glutamine amidotransferase
MATRFARILVVVALTVAGCTAPAEKATAVASLLVFTKTAGYRHDSIPDGVAALRAIGERSGLRVEATEDAAVFANEGIARYDALVFLDTTGSVLDAEQRAAVERFVRAGGGFVGIHAAADGDPDWAWYTGLIGAPFRGHPPIQPGRVIVVDRDHPATAELPVVWPRTDEWYDFVTNPRDHVRVLLTIDEGSYTGGLMGADHPLAWCQEYDGGRSFFTALGHTPESFGEPEFREHLLGGMRWAAGLVPADCDQAA